MVATNTGFKAQQAPCGRVVDGEVYHDRDGDWQFLCGTTLNTADLKLVCLGCMVEADPTVGELAEMPPGWCGTRSVRGEEWIQEPYIGREDEA